MYKINRRNIIAKSKMTNNVVKGDEIYFEKGHSYPKVFTLTIATGSREPIV